MKNAIIATMAVVIILLGALIGVLVQEPNTSVFEIDRDRVAVSQELIEAKSEEAKYSGGLVKSFLQLRLSILAITDAMLEQKRASIIRRISMTYPVGINPAIGASDAELNDIIDEIRQAEDRAKTSRNEAAKYTGGIVQGIALMKAETDEISVSELRLKFYSAKHGFPILPVTPAENGAKAKPAAPLGKIVGDKEAL